MEHEIDATLVENIVKQYDNYTFSVSSLQLCFAQVDTIKLFHIENGLQIASKKFKEIEKIHLLEFIESDEKLLIIGSLKKGEDLESDNDQESDKNQEKGDNKVLLKFIIWDLYDTGKYELMKLDDFSFTKTNREDIYPRLARASGNILYINDHGNVSSVLANAKKLKPKDVENEEKKISHTACRGNSSGTEPWILNFSPIRLQCLYCNKKETKLETLQLIVGRSTVQIWRQISDDKKNKNELPNKGEPFLEYIWSNNIPVNQERNQTKLRIENEFDGLLEMDDFQLKVYWYERKDDEENTKKEIYAKMNEYDIKKENDEIDKIEKGLKDINNSEKIKRCEKVIRRQDVIEKFHIVKHACKALLHIKKRYKNNKNNYKYEEMINYVEHIVWRFAKHEPENFRLLDVRYNLMKNLILGDCDRLVKFILFGYGETAEKKIDYRHIPSNKSWPGKNFIKGDDLFFDKKDDKLKVKHIYNNHYLNVMATQCRTMWNTLVAGYENLKRLLPDNPKYKFMPENNMELAIYHCRGRELKDAIIVAYLLEYYSRNPTNCVGWLCTVSKAIPLLFKYNYDDFARKLFIRCFADQGILGDPSVQDSDEIIPKEYLESYNNDTKFRAFAPEVKLKSDKPKWYDNGIWSQFRYYKNEFKYYKNEFKKSRNFEKSPIVLQMVPFPCFTANRISESRYSIFFIKVFVFLIIPRWYRISHDEKFKLSPFSMMILHENNDDIYDNPAIEAVIDFRWHKAKYFMYSLFLRFLIFATCFILISWAYLTRGNIINGYFLLVLIIIFYYLAIYQILTEIFQLIYRRPKKYFFDLLTIFDIISIILSFSVMSIMNNDFQLSNGFESVKETDPSLVVGISFSIFLIWIKFILFLRLKSDIGIYIYYVVIIFEAIIPFFWFMLAVIIAFAHTMFILLRDPKNTNIKIKESTYSGIATNLLTNEILDIKFKSDFDPTSKNNPFSAFFTSIEAAYFWIAGNWVQREQFDFWAVDFFALIASIFLVTILQNILIAFMNGVYSTAGTKGKQRLLRYQANHIVDYEALYQLYFSKPKPEPKHIYYFSQSKNFEGWDNKIKGEQCVIYEDHDFEVTSTSVIFKEKDYDEHSHLKYDEYDNNIKLVIEELLFIGNKLNVDIDNLIEIFKGDNSIEKIDKIDVKAKKKCLKVKVEKLHDILEELKKKDL
ncbi:unnamed protein product [Rhizophagus irregularis]|uniref:Ion transport domain-containing protein n=1 Tax=Rhizophagus irregularis TaxID=588596 RepID=A0A915ZSK6_9GLOM|nr:unnamed protein product [Rhizophagus irregularis]